MGADFILVYSTTPCANNRPGSVAGRPWAVRCIPPLVRKISLTSSSHFFSHCVRSALITRDTLTPFDSGWKKPALLDEARQLSGYPQNAVDGKEDEQDRRA